MTEPTKQELAAAIKIAACLAQMPRTLKIGAYDWSVVLEEDVNDNCGQADFEPHYIRLWPKNLTNPSHAVGITVHECLHVIFDNQALGKLRRGAEEREEQIVAGFEVGMVSLLRDNPKLFTWMRKWLR